MSALAPAVALSTLVSTFESVYDGPSGVGPRSRREGSPAHGRCLLRPSLTSTALVSNDTETGEKPGASAVTVTCPASGRERSITRLTPASTGSDFSPAKLSLPWATPPRHSIGPLTVNVTVSLARGQRLPPASTTSNCTNARSAPSAYVPSGPCIRVSFRSLGSPAVLMLLVTTGFIFLS